jgi:hypothetical protein
MRVCANLPPAARDVRLDLFRGLAGQGSATLNPEHPDGQDRGDHR